MAGFNGYSTDTNFSEQGEKNSNIVRLMPSHAAGRSGKGRGTNNI
jgi:hypothetical protein